LVRKSLMVGMKRELIHAEEVEGRKRRKEEPNRYNLPVFPEPKSQDAKPRGSPPFYITK
jgi:hypothetical protein